MRVSLSVFRKVFLRNSQVRILNQVFCKLSSRGSSISQDLPQLREEVQQACGTVDKVFHVSLSLYLYEL